MVEKLQWGVIGTGGIAKDFTEALTKSTRGEVVSVVGSSPQKARAFADRWRIPSAASSLGELLSDSKVEAVYVATPHPSHEEQAIACIEAKKHVLCEKPLTLDAASSERVIQAAKKHGVFLMEAFMYRCHPLLERLLEQLKDGVIGTLNHVRADFGFRVDRDPQHRLFKLELGGGSILDIGGYGVSFSRLMAGVVEGKPFCEPTRLEACGIFGPTQADELACALLSFDSGFTAQVTSAVHHEVGTEAVIFGEKGKIVLGDPWIPKSNRQGLATGYTIHRAGHDPEPVEIRTDKATYAIEAELVADTLPKTQAAWPAMSWDDTLGNMRTLDRWQAAIRVK